MLGLAVALAVPVAVASQAATAASPNCRSGRALYDHGGARLFGVSFKDHDGYPHQELLACLPSSRRPITVFDPGPFVYVQGGHVARFGPRLGFVANVEGFDNGSETDLGWLNLASGAVRRGVINAGENGGPHDPELPSGPIAYSIGADGAIAFIAGSSCQVVGLLDPRASAYDSSYRLGPPVVVSTAASGGLAYQSIALTATTVSWRTHAGMAVSVARPPAPTGTKISGAQTGGCSD
ncbi:MAG TPA: hypothetical protein VHX88_00325 [Solirubrobacteraceae bacterium]|nr:hypothetical protein [Solirubrobacteraceae bacterium]